MLYNVTLASIGKVSFSAGLVLLTTGLILILVALRQSSGAKTTGRHPIGQWLGRNWWVLLIVALVCTFIIVYFKSNYTTLQKDKYQILVDLILIIIGLSAAVGLGIFKFISRGVESHIEKEKELIKNSQTLSNARIIRVTGVIFWQLFDAEVAKRGDTQQEISEFGITMLEMAIGQSKFGLKNALDLPTIEYEHRREKYLSINNLISYLAEISKHEIRPVEPEEKKQALDLARKVLRETSKQEFPDVYYNFHESCASVLFHLTEKNDKVSKDEAEQIIRKIIKAADVPLEWREKIERRWIKYFDLKS